MRALTFAERFGEFLENPDSDHWLALRESILRHSEFAPYAADWQQLAQAFADQAFDAVLAISDGLSDLGCLSPRFHFFTGIAALETGDAARAAWEKHATQTCLEGLMLLGDGTSASPFLVTYPWDAYDLLGALCVEPMGQSLVDQGSKRCDVICDAAGEEYWFDVTELLARAHRTASRIAPVGVPETLGRER